MHASDLANLSLSGNNAYLTNVIDYQDFLSLVSLNPNTIWYSRILHSYMMFTAFLAVQFKTIHADVNIPKIIW